MFACYSSITFLLHTATSFFVQLQQIFGRSSVNGSLDKKPCQYSLSNIIQGVGAGSQNGLTLKVKEFPKYIRITVFKGLITLKVSVRETSPLCLPYLVSNDFIDLVHEYLYSRKEKHGLHLNGT